MTESIIQLYEVAIMSIPISGYHQSATRYQQIAE